MESLNNMKHQIAKLLIFTDSECEYIKMGAIEFIKKTPFLSPMDGFRIGAVMSEFVYNMRLLRSRIIGQSLSNHDIVTNDKFIFIMESYDTLIDFLIEEYQKHCYEHPEYTINLINSSKWTKPSMILNESQKIEIYEEINKIKIANNFE